MTNSELTKADNMRSLPFKDLSILIARYIDESTNLSFLKFVNIDRCSTHLSRLTPPSIEDRLILLDSIGLYTNIIFPKEITKNLMKIMVYIFKNTSITYIPDEYIPFMELILCDTYIENLSELNFIAENEELYYKLAIGGDNAAFDELEFKIFKLQLFMMTSLFMNMDEFLEFLYYYFDDKIIRPEA